MKPLHISISISLLLISLSLFPINNATITNQSSRRILHQPLFPDGSTPPPDVPPPPPPDSPPPPDLPFFHQNPEVVGPTTPSSSPSPPSPDQTQPPPAIPNATTATSPATTPPATKKLAIAISVGIVTLGMLSALCFFLYRHKHRVKQSTSNHHHHHQKLVHGTNSHNDTEGPPSSYLYLGTVEPPTTISHSPSQQLGQQLGQQLSQQLSQRDEFINNNNNNNININDHNKVINIPAKRSSDRYRPSPELQPLPPLTKPLDGNFPPEVSTSSSSSPSPSPASENSDEESRGMAFHTPHGSAMSYEDGYFTPISRQSSLAHDSPAAPAPAPARGEGDSGGNSRPFSKRTSPRNRFTASSPDVRPVIIPSIKPAPPPPPPPPPPLVNSGTSRRPKFSAPPPAPNLMHLRSTAAPTAPPPPVAVGVPSSSSGSGKRQTWSERGGIKESNSCEHVDGDEMEGGKPKLKALHWDKVRATSDCATVWDQLKSSSFQLNEDMMESLFGFNSTNVAPTEPPRKMVVPPVVNQEEKVLDPKKSQNIAILLRALNVTRDEVCEALLDGNPEGLGTELFETLVKMAPTKEEEIKLKKYDGDLSKLGSAERFLKAVLDIPFAFKRVEALLYRANFDYEVNYLRKSFQTLEAASEELKNSRLFLKLLEAVLRSGNRMNVGTNRGDAKAFKLDTLLKLVDIKGTDGKTTLLHFVVQEIIRSEGMSGDSANENGQKQMNPKFNEDEFKKQGLQVVAGLGRDLGNVKKAATMDSDVLSSYVAKLESGLEKVRSVLQLEKPDTKGNFFNSMKLFLRDAGEEIVRIKEDERKALFLVKEVTEYFHGNAVKEEAHPFKIFMIVKDFLHILDNVCKEVGRMQDRVMVGAARSFRIASTASLPVLNKYHARQDRSSDEESSSP